MISCIIEVVWIDILSFYRAQQCWEFSESAENYKNLLESMDSNLIQINKVSIDSKFKKFGQWTVRIIWFNAIKDSVSIHRFPNL